MNAPASLSTARRRWSLRARLIALVLAVAAVALIAVDLVLPLSIRASLIADRDATLTSARFGSTRAATPTAIRPWGATR